ncbi:MAG: GlsB/YeaQ/YmgE family stress response membrane protein [Verrucomicrobiales bacterium]
MIGDFIIFLIIGGVAGWLAGVIVRGGGFGVLGNILIGILGAIIGGAVFRALNVQALGAAGQFITALAGAVILVFVFSMLRGGRRRR